MHKVNDMNMETIEVKAFVPARDFNLSKRFYTDMGFTIAWSDEALAYVHAGNTSFLLQNFYLHEHAENFMMHLLVADVESWWTHIQKNGLIDRYDVKVSPPRDQPWAIRDFSIADPTGVCWRIGQNIG